MHCKICGKKAHSEYCFKHKPRKRLKASLPQKDNIQMREMFLSIWRKRPHYSEISNTWLGKEPLTLFFHHIIKKSDEKYGELAINDEENIIILTPTEHGNVELDMYRYEEINRRREKLLEKYNKILEHGKTI